MLTYSGVKYQIMLRGVFDVRGTGSWRQLS